MEGSEQFATLEEALRTNLILFDYGRVLGSQIEDVFGSTIERVINYTELTQETLKAQGRWDSFRDGLRVLILPPGRMRSTQGAGRVRLRACNGTTYAFSSPWPEADDHR